MRSEAPQNGPSQAITAFTVAVAALALAPYAGNVGSAGEAEAVAADVATASETLDDVAARLKKAVGLDWRVATERSAFTSRGQISANRPTWYNVAVPYVVVPALPADRVNQPPAGFRGSMALEVIATDNRYTVAAGPSYEPEIALKILATLGLGLTKEAEQHRLADSAADWLDLRLAVVEDTGQDDMERVDTAQADTSPRPLADGPTLKQIDDFTKLFAEKGPNGGRHRGDPFLWYYVLDCCDVSPRYITTEDRHTAAYVLLSDRPADVLLGASRRPRPWYLERVAATRDAQGRPAVELVFDKVAAAKMAQLTAAHSGRALAVLFDNQVVAIQTIDHPPRGRWVLSGPRFDDHLVARIVRSLRECMLAPQAADDRVSNRI